jgi:hypothetical protein
MTELLAHPMVQGGLAPFAAALLVALVFLPVRLSGLAIIAGFAVTVYLVSGFAFEPLTSTRKIVLLGIASGLVGVLFNLLGGFLWRPFIAVLAAACAVWVCMRVLQQQPLALALQWGFACAFYVGWLVYLMDGLSETPVRASSAGLALGLGTGLAALMGSSALLGQYGMSLGMAAMAYAFIMLISNRELPCGRSFTLPLGLTTGLIGCFAVLTAQLPWYALFPLAAVPLATKLPVPRKSIVLVQLMVTSIGPLALAAGAVYLSWRVNGAPPF